MNEMMSFSRHRKSWTLLYSMSKCLIYACFEVTGRPDVSVDMRQLLYHCWSIMAYWDPWWVGWKESLQSLTTGRKIMNLQYFKPKCSCGWTEHSLYFLLAWLVCCQLQVKLQSTHDPKSLDELEMWLLFFGCFLFCVCLKYFLFQKKHPLPNVVI